MSDSKKKLTRAELEKREEELEAKEIPLTYEEFKELDLLKKKLERGEIIINDKHFKCNKCGQAYYIRIQHVFDYNLMCFACHCFNCSPVIYN